MTRLGTGLGDIMRDAESSPKVIAARFGLTTGDMLPPKPKAIDPDEPASPSRRRRTQIERQAEEDLGIVVLALIGHAARVPLKMSNEGGQAVAIAMSADPRLVYMTQDEIDRTGGLAARTDHEQAFEEHRFVELVRVYVAHDRHAGLFKPALESALIGSTGRARRRFRNIPVEFDMDMLSLFFAQASEDAGVPCFDAGERDRRKRVRMQQLERKAKGK